jgi:hypothetical protein
VKSIKTVLFMDPRELRGSHAVNLLLTELEKHDGISILVRHLIPLADAVLDSASTVLSPK